MIEEIVLEDGKYKIRYNRETGEFKAFRHDFEWRNLLGDKLVYSMFVKLLISGYMKCWKTKSLFDNSPNGEVHIYEHGDKTFCGEEIDENWWISDVRDMVVTCPTCKIEHASSQ